MLGPWPRRGWVHLQPSVLLLITHLLEKRWLVLFSSRLMLRLMTRLDLPSSWVLRYFTCVIMLFFLRFPRTDHTLMQFGSYEVVEIGYFGE